MARSTRRTVQVALVSTLLASAGAGTYFVTTSDGSWLAKLRGPGELVADENALPADTAAPLDAAAVEITAVSADAAGSTEKLSQAELDAVASVWSRSDEAAASLGTAATEITDDRYAPSAISNEVAENATPDVADIPSADIPVMLPAAGARDVTRGQEPTEYGAEEDAAVPPPAVLEETPEQPDSSRRAREAFGDDMAAAPITPQTASDRYGAEHAPSHESPAHESPAPKSSTVASNPFDASGAAAPAPMPAVQAEPIDYQPADIRTANNAYRPERSVAAEPNAAADPLGGASDPAALPSENAPVVSSIDAPVSAAGEGTGRPGERALEGAQKPALLIQKFAPPEIQVGKAAKFAVQVRNVGGQTAESVIIRDEIPQGTKLVGTTPRATNEGSQLVWDLGSLSTGEERTVEIELMPLVEGEIGSVATVSCAAHASAKTRCTMPQLAIRMTSPQQVMIGQEQRVKIELRNPGTGDATGVMLLENVPDNVKHAAGPALEFEIGTLRAGETRELELVLTAERAGPVENVLTARADGNLQVTQQVDFEVIAPALQLSVEGPERRYLERPATYQVLIENPGTAPAHDIELVTKLPKGMQFVKANNMGEYDAATHSVYWSLAQLPEGEKGSVELVAMPVETGDQTLEIEGKAQQGLTAETKQEVRVEGLAAIMFEVRDLADPIEVGGETTYEIRVTNQGSKAATNVQVTVSLSPGIEAVSASAETSHRVDEGRITFEPMPQLAPKTDTLYRVQVKGVQPGDQRVAVQVNTDDISQPIRREESTRVFGDE